MINISTKYHLNEKVYTIKHVELKKKVKCIICEGEGVIVHKEIPILCPNCKNKDVYVNTGCLVWEVIEEPFEITSIKIKYNGEDKYTVSYRFGSFKSSENNVFSSLEAAQCKCNELNKALINNPIIENEIERSNHITIDNKYDIGDYVYADVRSKHDNKLDLIRKKCIITSIRVYILKDFTRIKYKTDKCLRGEEYLYKVE